MQIAIGPSLGAGVGATPLVLDTFTRANNASSLGSAETGQAWTAHVGTWGVGSEMALVGATANALATVPAGVSDGLVRVTIATVGADPGLCFRYSDASNHWRFVYTSGGWFLQKRVAGSLTTVGTGSASRAAGDVMEIEARGSLIIARLNGGQLASVTDTFNQSATRHGLATAAASSASRWDNFRVVR